MAAAWRIRPALAVEAEVLATVHALCFADPDVAGSAWSAQAIADLMGLPGVAALIAQDEQEPLGMALIRTVVDEAEILTIGVTPQARGRGLGAALTRACVDAAATAGAAALYLEVAETNAPARRLYAATGFEPVGRRANYYHLGGQPVAALLLRRAVVADAER
ncbi:GNAT family N-acetyltransferase [Nitrospirillum amazonense]|uniref:Ribosomal-protein-alanine N-acetyltransferase n=1 Tax=Nitrospirillum amazonense TaxID=28077 RepID=A0A560JW36_9PROT|nr:GNAT family N-acetyltransferase [Nitrospirillum amazonense]MDG3440331.1 GNAT family N-acetyltransferase [Nitrospirillum amazonense]TWB75333.1 ribosomal-protein-alanine N-acetyltransferase [Nitrospirillum amazonense]